MNKINCRYAISNGKITENLIITVENSKIAALEVDSSMNEFDFDVISPGLVDLHINGGEEHHFTANPSYASLVDIEQSCLKNGTTHCLPTIITSPLSTMTSAHDAMDHYYHEHPQSGILGVHLEGPFLAREKRGAHLESFLQDPQDGLLNTIIGWEHVRLITIAAELFSKTQLSVLLASKIKVALGHSNARFDQAQEAFGHGINLVTHLYNAMSGFGHRELGLVGAALYNENVYCPIILDNFHCAKEAAQLAYKLKGEKLFLISDALFQNHTKNEFKWNDFDAHYRDTTYFNSEGNLAGASISMWDAVRNAMAWFDLPLEKALKMATAIPASILYTDRKFGQLSVGFEAKMISIDNDKVDVI